LFIIIVMANSLNLVCVGIHRDTHAKLASMKRDEIDTFDIVITRLIVAQKKENSSDGSNVGARITQVPHSTEETYNGKI
jgi:predicted CopG family antitoxin